jgi:nitrate reductase (cytochrome)
MGFNQHQRGTWVNEQAYMNHLLTGRQCKPGDGAFSLTGQPSACGTAREVGHLRAPPAGRHGGDEPEAPGDSPRKIWKLPAKTINPQMGSHFVKIMRDLEDGRCCSVGPRSTTRGRTPPTSITGSRARAR